MRSPDYWKDGWCLDDGVARHLEAPDTFWIPDLELRKALEPGDLAQLMFRIRMDEDVVERMWVIVRERIPEGYIGMLGNTPYTINENDRLWLGTEFRFEYRHIITIKPGHKKSKALAIAPAPIPWTKN